MKRTMATLALAVGFSTGIASAQTTWHATLTGSQEVPVNLSTATGIGTLVLNAAQTQITVDESWTGLAGPATVSHIHGPALPGFSASPIFTFTGVPSATSGAIPEQTFAITAAQVGFLTSGQLYFNVHDTVFGGGEIRGQILPVPEPSTWALFGLSAAGLLWGLRRRTK